MGTKSSIAMLLLDAIMDSVILLFVRFLLKLKLHFNIFKTKFSDYYFCHVDTLLGLQALCKAKFSKEIHRILPSVHKCRRRRREGSLGDDLYFQKKVDFLTFDKIFKRLFNVLKVSRLEITHIYG